MKNPNIATGALTRRQALAASALGIAGLGSISQVHAQSDTIPDKLLTALHQETEIHAGAEQIYTALLSSKQFAQFSGMAAEISPRAGGAFKMFGGLIMGRNIELVPVKRIVQAWRPGSWPAGVYSVVKFELKPTGSSTTIILDHTGFPEGDFASLSEGWHMHYWEPLKKLFA